MFQMNKTLNHLINYKNKKKCKSKNKSTIIERFLIQNQKYPMKLTLLNDYQNVIRNSNSKKKKNNNSKNSFSQKNKSFSKEKSPQLKQNKLGLTHTKNVKSINSLPNKLKLDLLLKKATPQNKIIHKRENKLNLKEYKQTIMNRSNSISNLEQTITTTSTTMTSKRKKTTSKNINIKTLNLNNILKKQKKKNESKNLIFESYNSTDYNNNKVFQTQNNENKNIIKNNNNNNINTNNKNINNEFDLISNDSVFFNSKQTSNTVTNNNSKEKNNNNGFNESEQQTITLTYTEDDNNDINFKNYPYEFSRQKKNHDNNIIIQNEDFLTFYQQMNKKLFGEK